MSYKTPKDLSREPALIPTKRFAEIIDKTEEYVRKLCREGELDAVKVGNFWYIRKEAYVGSNNRNLDICLEQLLSDVAFIKEHLQKQSQYQSI